MKLKEEELKISIEINEKVLCDFSEKINEESIIKVATKIENYLLDNGASSSKIRSIYELTVEMFQNMLNYSYGNKNIDTNKMEADGSFLISYDTQSDLYILRSCNLIQNNQEAILKQKFESIAELDDKGLRKLSREKMRDRSDNHSKGAGLGFIMMAKKSSQPIQYQFKKFDENLKEFHLMVTV